VEENKICVIDPPLYKLIDQNQLRKKKEKVNWDLMIEKIIRLENKSIIHLMDILRKFFGIN